VGSPVTDGSRYLYYFGGVVLMLVILKMLLGLDYDYH
jgi:hypothetical protein